MNLVQLKELAKSEGLPSSGNKATLIQRINDASSTPSSNGKAAPKPTPPELRVGVQLDAKSVAAMGLKLTAASTDMNGQPEYVYTKVGTATSSGSAVRVTGKNTVKGAIDKKGKTKKKGEKKREVCDAAIEEAMDCVVRRLDSKKVPMALIQKLLKYLVDEKEIPNQKMKVYKKFATLTHETDSKKKCKKGKVSEAAFKAAVAYFVDCLKNVPKELIQEILTYFVDKKDIPKPKQKVDEEFAEQTHYETDSDSDSESDDE